MQSMYDRLLTLVERGTGKLGPVTSLLDSLMTHIVPQATGKACTGRHWCTSVCLVQCSPPLMRATDFYGDSWLGCWWFTSDCTEDCGTC